MQGAQEDSIGLADRKGELKFKLEQMLKDRAMWAGALKVLGRYAQR